MRKYLLIISVLGLLFVSCKKGTTLSGSYYVSDPNNSLLPAYSESGYNTFGAMYDNISMICNQNVDFAYFTTDLMSVFELNFYAPSYYYDSNQSFTIYFKLNDFLPSNYAELLSLDGKTYDFKELNSSFTLYYDDEPIDYQLIDGEIEFHKVQPMRIDEVVSGTVLSGYFSMKFISEGQPHSIYDGRFDVCIQDYNFYDLRIR